jgi:hypothetical protein
MLWIIFSGVFIVSFSTISSAMTSYAPNLLPYIQDPVGNTNWLDFKSFENSRILYVVEDGGRINKSGMYPVMTGWNRDISNTFYSKGMSSIS